MSYGISRLYLPKNKVECPLRVIIECALNWTMTVMHHRDVTPIQAIKNDHVGRMNGTPLYWNERDHPIARETSMESPKEGVESLNTEGFGWAYVPLPPLQFTP